VLLRILLASSQLWFAEVLQKLPGDDYAAVNILPDHPKGDENVTGIVVN
jgi:hypothetical protein